MANKLETVVLSRSADGKEVKTEDRPPHGSIPRAFRCKNCGHLHGAGHAGENAVPHACSVCGAGVALNPRTKALAEELSAPTVSAERRTAIAAEMLSIARTGETEKHVDPDNWEVLADCTDERLAELGLDRGKVCKHEGKPVVKGVVLGNRVGVQAQEML